MFGDDVCEYVVQCVEHGLDVDTPCADPAVSTSAVDPQKLSCRRPLLIGLSADLREA